MSARHGPPKSSPELGTLEQYEEPGNILGHSAVQLFVGSTRLLLSDFSPDGENLPVIAGICRRLDGIPLAIELAATRVASLGLQQVAAGLNDRLGMLTGGRRTALPRHQTLRATLDWSYDLLSEPERLVMRRLAVFASGFTAQAASLVASGGEIVASEVVRSLANLVTKSLVTLEVGSAIAHHRLHETTRAYALEKLTESGEFDQVARRHANHYMGIFQRTEIELETLSAAAWLTAYGDQIGEVRAALDWAFSPTGAPEVGVMLTLAAVPLWVSLSLMKECRGRVEQALSGTAESRDAHRSMQLYAALGAALFLTRGSRPDMVAAWTIVLEIAESLDDANYRLRALWGLFLDCITGGRYRAALAMAERFRTCAAKSTDPSDGPIGDRLVGLALLVLGDLEGARRHIERMLGSYVARKSHIIRFQFDQRLLAQSHHSLILWMQGFPDQAIRSVECQVVDARAGDHPISLSNNLLQSACPLALFVGDLTLAERYIRALMEFSARYAAQFTNVGGADPSVYPPPVQCFRGILLVKRGDVGAGLKLLSTASTLVPQNAFSIIYTLFLFEIADALGRDGNATEWLSAINEALARSERNEECWCVAELLRVKGELTLRKGAAHAETEAEEHFLHSLDWARRQGALSWELRTSTSLARLQHNQGRLAEARSHLQSVYDRFSEGFETADLKAANALLNSLR